MNNNWKGFFIRSFRESSVQLWRNKFLSGATILLGALILFLLNFVFSIKFFADYSLKNLESRADFSVPLQEGFDSFKFDALKNDLNNNFSVDLKLLEEESFENFSVPARLHVKFKKLTEVRAVFEMLKGIRYDEIIGLWDVSAEVDFTNLIEKLLTIRSGVEVASRWLLLLFLAGGVLLVINTFRIVIFSRREEISIARLVGADTWFIAGPFLMEGLLMGILSALIAIFTFIFVLRKIAIFPGGEIFLYLWNNVFPYEIFVAGSIGILGAWLAIKRYLFAPLSEH